MSLWKSDRDDAAGFLAQDSSMALSPAEVSAMYMQARANAQQAAGLQNAFAQYNANAYNSAVGGSLTAYQTSTGILSQPLHPASQEATPMEGLNDLAMSLGIDLTARGGDNWHLLMSVLKEIVQRTGIGRPIKKEEDFIGALVDAKEQADG